MARWLPVLLGALAIAALAIAAIVAVQARDFQRRSVVAPGEVVRLNAGPLHVDVEVRPAGAPPFVYAENGSHVPLAVGQRFPVRYLADAPAPSARRDTGDPFVTARALAWMALALLVAAIVSPWLLRLFPGVLASPIR